MSYSSPVKATNVGQISIHRNVLKDTYEQSMNGFKHLIWNLGIIAFDSVVTQYEKGFSECSTTVDEPPTKKKKIDSFKNKSNPLKRKSDNTSSLHEEAKAQDSSTIQILSEVGTERLEQTSLETMENTGMKSSAVCHQHFIKNSTITTSWPRPNLKFPELLLLVLKNGCGQENEGMTAREIFKFITENFPFYDNMTKIRSVLRSTILSCCCIVEADNVVGRCNNRGTYFSSRKWRIVNECIAEAGINMESIRNLNLDSMAHPERLQMYLRNIFSCAMYPEDEDPLLMDTDERWKFPRPEMTSEQLAILAITNSESGEMKTAEIVQFIRDNFPFYSFERRKWRRALGIALHKNFGRRYTTKRIPGTKQFAVFRVVQQWLVLKAVADQCKQCVRAMAHPERLNTMISNILKYNSASVSSKTEAKYPESATENVKTNTVEQLNSSNTVVEKVTSTVNGQHNDLNAKAAGHTLSDTTAEKSLSDWPWPKPSLTFAELIIFAIKNSGNEGLCVSFSEITNFISKYFPYYSPKKATWKECIQRKLCFGPEFTQKVITNTKLPFGCEAELEQPPDHCLWTVVEDDIKEHISSIEEKCQREVTGMAYPKLLDEMLLNLVTKRAPVEINEMEGSNEKSDECFDIIAADCLQVVIEEGPVEAKVWDQPPFSFTQMAFLALLSDASHFMTVDQIVHFIKENFPHYRTLEDWKSCLVIYLGSSNYMRCACKHAYGNAVWTFEKTEALRVLREIEDILVTSQGTIASSVFVPEYLEELVAFSMDGDNTVEDSNADAALSVGSGKKLKKIDVGRHVSTVEVPEIKIEEEFLF